MQYSLHIDDFQLSDSDQELLDKKLNRFEKRLQPPYVADVNFSRESHQNKGDTIRCAINIKHGKKLHHAERICATVQDALDQVLDALEKELDKEKSKEKSARHN